jgi:hypothetical protein
MKFALTPPQEEQMAPSSDSPQGPQHILDHLLEFPKNSQYANHPGTKIVMYTT